MSRFKTLSILLLVLAIVLVGCERDPVSDDEAPEILVDLFVDPYPPVKGDTLLEIIVEDPDERPIDGVDLDVKGDMTHAGMKPRVGIVTAVGGGSYDVDFEWTMAGDWVLTVTGILPDGRKFVRTFDVPVGEKTD